MDYQRAELAEWYLNTEDGLQQGFNLQPASWAGGGSPEAFVLELALYGDLTPLLAEDGRGVEFKAPDGSLLLSYGNLQAVDAAGQILPVDLALLADNSAGNAILRLGLPPLSQPVTFTAWLTSPLSAENIPEGSPITRLDTRRRPGWWPGWHLGRHSRGCEWGWLQ
jgi:hypothetical protein